LHLAPEAEGGRSIGGLDRVPTNEHAAEVTLAS
jgi:hypothetical protein